MISRVSGRAHITPVLKQLYWLPVRQGITHKLLTLAFKAINCTDFPSYLGLQWSQLTRQLRSSGRQLVVPRTRTGALVTGPTMWWLLGSGMVYPTVSNCSRHLTLSKDTVIKTRLFREHFEGTWTLYNLVCRLLRTFNQNFYYKPVIPEFFSVFF